jgi:UDPglucose 6-dehydrogenase
VRGKTIALLGLTFKPNTDDMRVDILPALAAAGAKVVAYDPEAMKEAAHLLNGIGYADSAYKAVEGADALVIITEWDQFRALDMDRIKSAMKGNVVVDLRNIYSPEDMRRRGFAYTSIGRPVV